MKTKTIKVINHLHYSIFVAGAGNVSDASEKKQDGSASDATEIASGSTYDVVTDTTSKTIALDLTFTVPDLNAERVPSGADSAVSTLCGGQSAPAFRVQCGKPRNRNKNKWQSVGVEPVGGATSKSQNQARINAMMTTSTDAPTLLLLLPIRSSANFMSSLPDTQSFSSLCIPGTHETFARYGWPISQCQEVESTITKQLHDGIRFMDLRVRPDGQGKERKLWAFHGKRAQKIELGDALNQIYQFLDGVGSRETLILSLKPEQGNADEMQSLLFSLYINPSLSHWWLNSEFPQNLSEARGKIILFSRFGHWNTQPGGIHPTNWPDNHEGTFSYTLPGSLGQKINTQDWYNIGCWRFIPRKFELVKQLLTESASDPETFALDFISCAHFPLATPPLTAKGWWESGPSKLRIQGMNSRLLDLVADTLAGRPQHSADVATPGLQACFAIDFYGYDGAAQLIPLLIQANFTGRGG